MKNNYISLLIICLLASATLFSQTSNIEHALSINDDGSDPDASALLDVKSTTQGMLVPRMTTVQRDAIASPATGLLVFDTDEGSFWFYDGTDWLNLSAPDRISDKDGDTQVQVEESADEDIIRFDVAGSERLKINSTSSEYQGRFKVNQGTVWFEGASGTLPTTGAGTRLMWLPAKKAFRAGEVDGTQWDGSNIGFHSAVVGGDNNVASGPNSFIGGGELDTASADYSFVGGGINNKASGAGSFVGGGNSNKATSNSSFIAGGGSNTTSDINAFVGGGGGNTSSGAGSFVGGGLGNESSQTYSFVGGGSGNNADGVSSFIGGGGDGTASATNSFVGGGTSLVSRSYCEAVFGHHNEDYTAASKTAINLRDRLFIVGNGTNAASRSNALTIMKNGQTGIGRIPVTNLFEVDGNASKNAAGNWLANSDARLKKNIEALSANEMLQKLLALKGITYEWNDTETGTKRPEGLHYGFTAQNIQEVFPTLVEEDKLGFLQTAYGTYDAMTVEAIRALNNRIEKLEQDKMGLKKMIEQQGTSILDLQEAVLRLESVVSEERL